MSQKSKDNTVKIVLTAMFAALIAVMTAFIKIPTPTGGYIHLGDSMIYISACFLPFPFSMISAALGGGLADLLVYPETLIYTVIIKALNTTMFTNKNEKILSKSNIIRTLFSGLITIIGYSISKFIRDLLIGTTVAAALTDGLYKMPENSIQAAASTIIFIIIATAFDKAQIRKRFGIGR